MRKRKRKMKAFPPQPRPPRPPARWSRPSPPALWTSPGPPQGPPPTPPGAAPAPAPAPTHPMSFQGNSGVLDHSKPKVCEGRGLGQFQEIPRGQFKSTTFRTPPFSSQSSSTTPSLLLRVPSSPTARPPSSERPTCGPSPSTLSRFRFHLFPLTACEMS